MPDSLFGSDDESQDLPDPIRPATLGSLAVPGFYLIRNIASEELQHALVESIAAQHYFDLKNDQVMLWNDAARTATASLWLNLPFLLKAHLPPALNRELQNMHCCLQVILNLYQPGKGITPHVDLPSRYGPLVLGVSLLSETVMELSKGDTCHAVLLRPGDVYLLTGEARYEWMHGIPARRSDQIAKPDGTTYEQQRALRLSVTMRGMLPDADVLA